MSELGLTKTSSLGLKTSRRVEEQKKSMMMRSDLSKGEEERPK